MHNHITLLAFGRNERGRTSDIVKRNDTKKKYDNAFALSHFVVNLAYHTTFFGAFLSQIHVDTKGGK